MTSLIEEADVFVDENSSSQRELEPSFGILFDIDGVIARGLNPLPIALDMISLLKDQNGELKVPIAFVTNACNKSAQKAKQVSNWLKCDVTPDQVIHAQSPLSVFTTWHHKHVLFIGQGPVREIAEDAGFTNVCTIDQIKDAYPLLDMVDHSNRRKVANGYVEKEFPRVEAIILIGEPVRWESCLQLLIDLMITNGKPDHNPEDYPSQHLPVLACNMDLVFMAEACMPRFGHGSFLICLESLYEKITGYQLKYTAIIGKPSEITYRFAEHTIMEVRKRMGIMTPLKKLYFLGDNPEVDIMGTNLYNRYLHRCRKLSQGSIPHVQPILGEIRRRASVSDSRRIPEDAEFSIQCARSIDSILVSTGVFNPDKKKPAKVFHGHRDFECKQELMTPTIYTENCYTAVQTILQMERFDPKVIEE